MTFGPFAVGPIVASNGPTRRRRILLAIGGMVMVAVIGILADGWQSFAAKAMAKTTGGELPHPVDAA